MTAGVITSETVTSSVPIQRSAPFTSVNWSANACKLAPSVCISICCVP